MANSNFREPLRSVRMPWNPFQCKWNDATFSRQKTSARIDFLQVTQVALSEPWGPFLESPENFSGLGPVSRRSPKVFGPGKPQQKSQTLSLESCSFHILLIWTNFPFMQSFMPIHFFVFKIRTIENGFADPKRFRDFRETGPWEAIFNCLYIENKEVYGHETLHEGKLCSY